ncbi:MAG TPA: hypothetical protein VLW75_01940 [Rhizomicrobium sp.]|nr:hypothetical protein [Rhizomicrobium sp.]
MPNKKQPIERFMPPNMLKVKVGGTLGGLDRGAILRAEKALDNIKSEFTNWIEADVARLSEYRDAFEAKPDAEARAKFYRASLDLKGQALTYEYPLVARVAVSLCKMLHHDAESFPLALIDAHVDAIRVIVRDKVQNKGDKITMALVAELEKQVAEFEASCR